MPLESLPTGKNIYFWICFIQINQTICSRKKCKIKASREEFGLSYYVKITCVNTEQLQMCMHMCTCCWCCIHRKRAKQFELFVCFIIQHLRPFGAADSAHIFTYVKMIYHKNKKFMKNKFNTVFSVTIYIIAWIKLYWLLKLFERSIWWSNTIFKYILT